MSAQGISIDMSNHSFLVLIELQNYVYMLLLMVLQWIFGRWEWFLQRFYCMVD